MTVNYVSQYPTVAIFTAYQVKPLLSPLKTDLFIYSQSARDLELYKGIQITRDTIGPSNYVHITLIEQVGYWVHIRIHFFDKKFSRFHHGQTP